MPHFVRVELSDETAAHLGDLSTTTGAPPAELVRAAVEAKYGHRPAPRSRPHLPPKRFVRRTRNEPAFAEYGGEG